MNYDFQRASLMKRVPAWLLDMILLVIVAVGIVAGLAYAVDMDAHSEALDAIYVRYETEYGVDFGITAEEAEKLTEEQLAVYEAANEALSKDPEAQKTYELFVNLTLVVLSGGILGAFLLLEFLVPLWLKNGQTLGKKVFGVALMRKDGIKVTPFMMFARAILGKFTVETMIPLLLIIAAAFGIMGLDGLLFGGLFLLAQVIVTLVTRDKTAIHDLMACTVAVDLSSQMIFDSPEAMEAYHSDIITDEAEPDGE